MYWSTRMATLSYVTLASRFYRHRTAIIHGILKRSQTMHRAPVQFQALQSQLGRKALKWPRQPSLARSSTRRLSFSSNKSTVGSRTCGPSDVSYTNLSSVYLPFSISRAIVETQSVESFVSPLTEQSICLWYYSLLYHNVPSLCEQSSRPTLD